MVVSDQSYFVDLVDSSTNSYLGDVSWKRIGSRASSLYHGKKNAATEEMSRPIAEIGIWTHLRSSSSYYRYCGFIPEQQQPQITVDIPHRKIWLPLV